MDQWIELVPTTAILLTSFESYRSWLTFRLCKVRHEWCMLVTFSIIILFLSGESLNVQKQGGENVLGIQYSRKSSEWLLSTSTACSLFVPWPDCYDSHTYCICHRVSMSMTNQISWWHTTPNWDMGLVWVGDRGTCPPMFLGVGPHVSQGKMFLFSVFSA